MDKLYAFLGMSNIKKSKKRYTCRSFHSIKNTKQMYHYINDKNAFANDLCSAIIPLWYTKYYTKLSGGNKANTIKSKAVIISPTKYKKYAYRKNSLFCSKITDSYRCTSFKYIKDKINKDGKY